MEHETEPRVDFEPAAELRWTAPTRNEDLTVPLVDEHEAGRIYDPSILRWALWGGLLGGLLLGWLGYAVAAGDLPIAGLGQWAANGAAGGAVAGAGMGLAVGGLVGALFALYRMPPRLLDQNHQEDESERPVNEPSPKPS